MSFILASQATVLGVRLQPATRLLHAGEASTGARRRRGDPFQENASVFLKNFSLCNDITY